MAILMICKNVEILLIQKILDTTVVFNQSHSSVSHYAATTALCNDSNAVKLQLHFSFCIHSPSQIVAQSS